MNINLDGFNASFKDLCKRSEGLRPEKPQAPDPLADFKSLCLNPESLSGADQHTSAPGAKPPKPRTARLVAKLEGVFDQSRGATVRIVPTGKDFLVSVRPRGRRREYTLLLSELARIIITRVAMAEKPVTQWRKKE